MQNAMHLFLDGWLRGGHMMDMGRGFFFFPGGLIGLFALLALVVLIIWAIRARNANQMAPVTSGGNSRWDTASTTPLASPPAPTTGSATPTTVVDRPLDALQLRYAKGEISRAEYDTIRQDILRDRGAVQQREPVTEEPVSPAPPVATVSEPIVDEQPAVALPADAQTDDSPHDGRDGDSQNPPSA